MRLTISSTTLASRLSALSKVFNSKNSMPILDCYLFEVAGQTLTITASDSENVMTTQMQLDEFDVGDTVAVSFAGEVQESYPAHILDVVRLQLLDDEK